MDVARIRLRKLEEELLRRGVEPITHLQQEEEERRRRRGKR